MSSDSSSSIPPKGGMKGMVVGIVAVLVLAGVAVGLYQWSGGESMTPEERTTAMAKKVGEVESASFKTTMIASLGETSQSEVSTALSAYGVEGDIADIVLTAEGVSSMKAGEKPQSSVDVTLRGENAEGEEQISLGMSARMIDKLIYAQLHALPEGISSALTEQAGVDLSFLEDQWVEVNMQELAEQLGVPAEELAALEGTELTQEERDMVTTAFVDHTFLKLSGEGESEKIQGEATLKYDAQLDIVQLKAFLEAVKPVLLARDVKEEDFNNMLETLENDYNAALEESNLETHVWVGKKDNNLYKVEMIISPKDETDIAELKSITVALEIWDHNKAVEVETPEDAMTVQEVVGQLIFEAGGAQIDESAKDVQPDAEVAPTTEEEPAEKKADKQE